MRVRGSAHPKLEHLPCQVGTLQQVMTSCCSTERNQISGASMDADPRGLLRSTQRKLHANKA